ncbi:MAG TPA: bifunctional transaldolase/phosoglucose isomerase [Ktedonobacterales bacterium]|nr:bifunctional transaldolase/phosoglucose isomerase [Ktedonobacterales bacterium]
MATNRLEQVYQLGQSIWYDNIRRGLITSGDLQKLIDDDAVVGVTSNPTIFEKAIDGSDDYDEAICELIDQGVTSAQQVVEALMIRDIQLAADIFRPIFERTNHTDGYVSIEVAPALARDTKQTIAEARRLFQLVERPNVMVKIPATEEGLPAIEQMIYEGVNINVTLIFSLDRYEAVTEAFIRGLEHRRREGQGVSDIASVASFFVSRVDTLVDKLLDERIGATEDETQQETLRTLQGKAAIANARLAYEKYRGIFHGKRFAALEIEHAQRQRCLWASTSTKNPAYPDTYYVDALIGPETVDTVPPQTIVAFQGHGTVKETLADDIAGMHAIMGRLADAGINMDDVTHQLEVEGVKTFADSYQKLLAATEEKIARLQGQRQSAGAPPEAVAAGGTGDSVAPTLAGRVTAKLGGYQQAVDTALDRSDTEHFARRVWEKDPTLWKPAGQDQSEIVDRLGWLTVAEQMGEMLPRLNDLRDDVRKAGFTHAVLLGMGGSSLAPEVLRETLGIATGQPDLIVLDSTDPATILDDQQAVDLRHTLFIVASKSGGTLETLSQYRYFYAKIHELAGDQAGSQFIAITDPGTKLETLAKDQKFRAIFRNPPDIGGRYSALSFFGLVPAAIIGVDVERLLDRAQTMQQACHGSGEARQNPGLYLGAVMGTLAKAGRDKVTLVMSPPISTFGYWIEQLIAESTGKEGKGILPVEGEPLGSPAVYGDDRLFVYLRTDQGYDDVTDTKVRALEEAGQPVVRIALEDAYDLGMEFFRWEFATAIAGILLGINAFNQPNVQESKDNTDRILAEYAVSKTLLQPQPILRTDHVAIVAGEREARELVDAVSLQAALEAYFRRVRPGDYVALLAYVQKSGMTEDSLEAIRARLRDLTKAATTLGYGPRFQHSTGQLHKGGPNTGVFVQFVADDEVDAPIPDEPYTFGVLKQAQALGDLRSLEAHGRRVIRLALGADVAAGLAEVQRALDAANMA